MCPTFVNDCSNKSFPNTFTFSTTYTMFRKSMVIQIKIYDEISLEISVLKSLEPQKNSFKNFCLCMYVVAVAKASAKKYGFTIQVHFLEFPIPKNKHFNVSQSPSR